MTEHDRLNQMIAEKVMGWYASYTIYPSFTTDPTQAVEAAKKVFRKYTLKCYEDGMCEFWGTTRNTNITHKGKAEGYDALAICRAIEKAVEDKDG